MRFQTLFSSFRELKILNTTWFRWFQMKTYSVQFSCTDLLWWCFRDYVSNLVQIYRVYSKLSLIRNYFFRSFFWSLCVCVLHFPSRTVIAQILEPFEIEYNSKRPTAWWFVFQTTRVILNEQQWKCLFCLLADGNASIQLACVCCQREKKGTVDIPQLPGRRWPANSGRPRRSYFPPVV